MLSAYPHWESNTQHSYLSFRIPTRQILFFFFLQAAVQPTLPFSSSFHAVSSLINATTVVSGAGFVLGLAAALSPSGFVRWCFARLRQSAGRDWLITDLLLLCL